MKWTDGDTEYLKNNYGNLDMEEQENNLDHTKL